MKTVLFGEKRYGRKHILLQEMIDKYQRQGYAPPFVLVSNKPVHVTEFDEIEYVVVDENCPRDIWYLVKKEYYEKYVKGFKI
jgi:hypothetical protein